MSYMVECGEHLWIATLLLVLVSEMMRCGTRREYPLVSPPVGARLLSFVILCLARVGCRYAAMLPVHIFCLGSYGSHLTILSIAVCNNGIT